MSRIPILLYHSVSNEVTARFRPYTIAPELFRSHMKLLADAGFMTLTVSELVRTIVAPKKLPEGPTVVITFDDGYADFAEAARPVLERLGLAATVYVTTAHIGGTSLWLERLGESGRRMLDWDSLRSMPESGVEVGAHGHSHKELDALPPAQASMEIARSKQVLEAGLGSRVDSFAYPHGYHNASVRQMVIDAGFTSACAVKEAASSPADDPFALARITIKADTSPSALHRLLDGEGLPAAPVREPVRTSLWRSARRMGHRTGVRRTA